jgi:hypothetical protein
MRRRDRFVRRAAGCISAFVVFVMSSGAGAQDRPKMKKFLTKPLTIEDQGSFFIGGVPKVTNYSGVPPANNPNAAPAPNQITIGQMYVQFQIPARKKNSPPVIMVHGSTHTGAALESTPDGREGWAPYFVRQGISTYVVDQAGRGRSGFDQSVIHEAAALIRSGQVERGLAMIPAFGRITDNGAWTAWFGHLLPAGSTILNGTLARHGDPNDPPGDDAAHANDYFPAFPLGAADLDIAARNGAIGDAPAGPPNYYALEYYKQLVPNAEATLPGSTCASCEPQAVSPANTWTPLALAALVEKLGGAIVATHSQSGIMGHHMARILKERGHLDLLKGLITVEGSCSLPNSGLKAEDFDAIPYMAIKGDYTALSEVCRTTVDQINARRDAGQGIAKAEYIKLDEAPNPVFKGTTHMMMLDTNNLQIADLMLKWVNDNVPPRKKNAVTRR